MRILFTGGSSFTGYWFIKELVNSGHEVIATFRKGEKEYEGIRGERVKKLAPLCQRVFYRSFGEEKFMDIIQKSFSLDIYCHHASEVTNYKADNFDILKATANNTKNSELVIKRLKDKGCRWIILTGSIGEANEGQGTDNLRAFSPYAISKSFTFEIFNYYCQIYRLPLGKFIIPNPFGPLEEERFTTYLVRSWSRKEMPVVKTPAYIRDNIPISLLSMMYNQFVQGVPPYNKPYRANPSYYIESQQSFAERFVYEMSKRLSLSCSFKVIPQVEFLEPLVRVNNMRPNIEELGWNEKNAWDDLAQYYQEYILNK